jgi:hypothetical protein
MPAEEGASRSPTEAQRDDRTAAQIGHGDGYAPDQEQGPRDAGEKDPADDPPEADDLGMLAAQGILGRCDRGVALALGRGGGRVEG